MHHTARLTAPAPAACRGGGPRESRPCPVGPPPRHAPRHLVALALLLATAPGLASAAPPGANGNGDRRVLQEIYAGVVSNHTISFTGQEFYRAFVAAWRDRELTDRYNISVKERPSARWGSLVWVEYSNRAVFQAFLSPARANVKEAAERAVEVAHRNVVESEVQRLLFREPDLGTDEF